MVKAGSLGALVELLDQKGGDPYDQLMASADEAAPEHLFHSRAAAEAAGRGNTAVADEFRQRAETRTDAAQHHGCGAPAAASAAPAQHSKEQRSSRGECRRHAKAKAVAFVQQRAKGKKQLKKNVQRQ